MQAKNREKSTTTVREKERRKGKVSLFFILLIKTLMDILSLVKHLY
jgi:hypothetical protein